MDFLWGFLSVAFGAALVRGHFGGPLTTGRISHGEVKDACRANGWSFDGDA